MRMQWIICSSAFLLALTMEPVFAWRCDHGLVSIGDSARQVRKKCGPPDYQYSDTGIYRRGRFKVIDEYWYYNYGPRLLLQELKFHKGRLEALNSPAYGFRADTRRCTPQDIIIGMTAYELAVRCGKPKSKRDRVIHTSGGKDSSGKQVKHTEEWTYDFGSQYLLQKVNIAGGRVQAREALSRSKHTDAGSADAGDKYQTTH